MAGSGPPSHKALINGQYTCQTFAVASITLMIMQNVSLLTLRIWEQTPAVGSRAMQLPLDVCGEAPVEGQAATPLAGTPMPTCLPEFWESFVPKSRAS